MSKRPDFKFVEMMIDVAEMLNDYPFVEVREALKDSEQCKLSRKEKKARECMQRIYDLLNEADKLAYTDVS